MLILKYFAILNASIIDGLYRPFSSEPIVCLDTSRAEREFGFKAKTNFEEGLKKMIESYRVRPAG